MKREAGIGQVRYSMCPVGHMILEGAEDSVDGESCKVN